MVRLLAAVPHRLVRMADCGDIVADVLCRWSCSDGGGISGVRVDRGVVLAQSHGQDVLDVPADYDGGVGWREGRG